MVADLNEHADDGREVTLEQLIELRARTETISKWLTSQLEEHLQTLRPLFSPKLLLGEFIRGSEKVPAKDAERHFDKLKDAYEHAAQEPLRLPLPLDRPIESIPNQPVLHPWEYSRLIEGGETVTIRSPVSWVLTFASSIGLAGARKMAAGVGRNAASLRSFSLHCLVMAALFECNPGLGRLFSALRFDAEVSRSPGLGNLGMIRLTAPLPAFRPADRLILQSARLSGIPEFQELVDIQGGSASLEDPLRRLLT